MNKKCYTLVELLVGIVGILVVCLIPLVALWTGRNLDFWISHFKGHPVHVPFILDLAITIIGDVAVLEGNIISEICKFFI